ncbi:MAG: hypothetical protein R3E66_18645 [bacterium]
MTSELAIDEIVTVPLTLDTPTAGVANTGEEVVYTLPALQGLVDVRVTGATTPTVKLLRSNGLDPVTEAVAVDGHLFWADASNLPLFVSVSNAGAFTITASQRLRTTATPEVEPNEPPSSEVIAAGDGISGTLGGADTVDAWRFDATAGAKVFAVTLPLTGSIYQLTGTLAIRDSNGTLLQSDNTSGDGFYPGIYGFAIPADGSYSLELSASSTGNYVLFFDIDP